MFSFWSLALRNLQRNVKRNLATGSAIAFGFAGILILIAYSNRVVNYLRVHTIYAAHTGHFVIYSAGGFESFDYKPKEFALTVDDQKRIEEVLRADSNVDMFERQLWGSGLIGNGCVSLPFFARGIEPDIDRRLMEFPQVRQWLPDFKSVVRGRALADFPSQLGPVALSLRLALGLGKTAVRDEREGVAPQIVDCLAEDARTKFSADSNVQMVGERWEGSLGAVDGEVVAHFSTGFDESDNSALLAPVSMLQKLYETEGIGRYSVWLKNPQTLKSTMERMQKALASQGKYEFRPWNDEKISPYYFGTIQFLMTLTGFLGSVMVVVVAFSVLNSTTMTVLERSDEIGTYRALGFRRSLVRRIFLQEAVWLCLISLIAGQLLGLGAITLINSMRIIYFPPGVSTGLRLILVPNAYMGLGVAFMILLLSLAATAVATYGRLRLEAAQLLGGTVR